MITRSHTENICQAKNQLQALIPCLVSICITTDNSFADVNIPKLCKTLRKPWTNFFANPISCIGGLNSTPRNYVSKTLLTISILLFATLIEVVHSGLFLQKIVCGKLPFSQQIFWGLHFTCIGFCFLIPIILHLQANKAYT